MAPFLSIALVEDNFKNTQKHIFQYLFLLDGSIARMEQGKDIMKGSSNSRAQTS